jgi:tetratricopeptide (TPR) repeat protein
MLPFVVSAIIVLGVVLGLWLLFGPSSRRRRAFHRAHRLLEQGAWSEALKLLHALQTDPTLSPAWQARVRTAVGEGHQLATDQALKEKRFEDGMEHAVRAAGLLEQNEQEQRFRVIDTMLAEVRRLFAAGTGPAETQATLHMLARVLALQTPCPEASFWQGLCLVRQGTLEPALHALGLAHEQVGRQFLDPAFYIGTLMHRQGQPHEGLRYLAEANRVDASCPFVTWQMGLSLVAAGGDSALALRALQRALGPRGLGTWAQHPQRAWVEAFPEGKSYVRRLSAKYPFVCPVLGNDLTILLRQGQLALAQAHYRQGNFQESADLYTKLLQDSPPTVALLRGLGLSLARLERYDQAYKHLRIALEQENPKDPFTAGYLALCGAMGKPTQPEDKPRNVQWAIRLLSRFPVTGNAEWAGIASLVLEEACTLNMEIAPDDQLLVCDALASVHATNNRAAAAYANLTRTFPDAVQPAHAWLYVRAATAGGFHSDQDLDLFARFFRDPAPARAYFDQRQWSFEDAEFTYLERTANQAPGSFPPALGSDYPPRGEDFLLTRSRAEEAAGRKDRAMASVEVLLKLAPGSVPGHDRLACLHYRRGNMDRAVALLDGWQRLAPADHWPLVRQAIIEQERGNAQRRGEAINRALGLTRGPLRAAIAFLGARLALRDAFRRGAPTAERRADPEPTTDEPRKVKDFYSNGNCPDCGEPIPESATEGDDCSSCGTVFGRDAAAEANSEGKEDHTAFRAPRSALADSMNLLQACLADDPDHVEALWCLAAVRSALNDREGLAAQAAVMDRPAVRDARFHYLGAVCHLAARDYPRVLELGQRALADEKLAAESHFVMAWAHLHLRDGNAAQQALLKVAAADKSPSAVYARALLGHLHFASGNSDAAIQWWSAVAPQRRAAWQLDDTLRQTVLLAGLEAYRDGRFEQAADRFREAGKLGLRDRRLGPLLTLALVKAGQRLLFEQTAPRPTGTGRERGTEPSREAVTRT